MYGTSARLSRMLLAVLLDQRVDLVLEHLVAFAQRDLALQVENRHVADDPFLDLHAGLLNGGSGADSPDTGLLAANSRKMSPQSKGERVLFTRSEKRSVLPVAGA